MTQASIITEIIKREGMEIWKELLEPMINWMNSDQANAMPSGLDTFCTIINDCDDRVHTIFPKLIPTLFKMFSKADVDETHSGCGGTEGTGSCAVLFVHREVGLGRRSLSRCGFRMLGEFLRVLGFAFQFYSFYRCE